MTSLSQKLNVDACEHLTTHTLIRSGCSSSYVELANLYTTPHVCARRNACVRHITRLCTHARNTANKHKIQQQTETKRDIGCVKYNPLPYPHVAAVARAPTLITRDRMHMWHKVSGSKQSLFCASHHPVAYLAVAPEVLGTVLQFQASLGQSLKAPSKRHQAKTATRTRPGRPSRTQGTLSEAAFSPAVVAHLLRPWADAVLAGGSVVGQMVSKYGGGHLAKLDLLGGAGAGANATAMLGALAGPLDNVIVNVSKYTHQIADTAKAYLPVAIATAGTVAGAVATAADALPVYRLLVARLAAETALARCRA